MKLTADEFNAKYPVGTPVRYYPLLDERRNPMGMPPVESVTRTPAWNLGHGDPVVSIEGRTGGVDLTHIELSDHLLAGTVWALNQHGQKFNSDPDSRDYSLYHEATRDVIFLFQIKRAGHFDPEYLTFDNATSDGDGGIWVDTDMFDDDEIKLAKAEDRYEEENSEHRFNAVRVDDDYLMEKGWVTSHWDTQSVWLSRAEAEAYAKAKAYKFGELGKSCRVFGDVSMGRLAKVLSVIQNKEVEAYLQSPEFSASYASYRKGHPVGTV